MHPSAYNIFPTKVEPREVKAEGEQAESSAKGKPIFTVDIPTMQCHLHGSSSHDADRSVKLEPGPQGLLVARFGEMVHTTELSNLMLSVPPAAQPKTKKKPAAPPAPAAEAPEASEAALAAVAAPASAAPLAAVAPAESLPAEAPAAPLPAEAAVAPATAPLPARLPAGSAKNDYSVMWYKRDLTCAIRARFGTKGQLLSFGGKRCPKTEKEMKDFAAILVADLHAGVSVADCRKKGKTFAAPQD